MPRNRDLRARVALTAAAMVGILVVAACEGENLFSVPGGSGGVAGNDAEVPEVAITIPRGDTLSAKPLGDSVFVSAHVADDLGVRTVRMYGVALRGDASLGTDEVVRRFEEKAITLPPGVRDTTLTRYIVATADSVKETALIVVEAADSVGNVAADTVSIVLGGPDVTLLDIAAGQSIQAGLNLTTRVLAKDPLGIIQIRVEVRGAFEATVVKAVSPPADSVMLDSIVPVPEGTTGQITVTAIARNNLDVAGQDGPLTLNVIAAGAGDTIAPRLRQVVTAPERMELQDKLTLQVTGADNSQGSGVAAVGYTVLGISPTRGDTLVRSAEVTYATPRTGTVSTTFEVPAFNVDSLNLPDTLVYEVTTWMEDADGNCGAAVGGDSLVAMSCAQGPTGETVALNRSGQRITRPIVAGKTVLLPAGGKIMDAAVDTARSKLYLSNIDRNRLEVFDFSTETFSAAIGVGSEPWGLAFTRDNDSLWVANSGGTNLSVVDLDVGKEVDDTRFLTPDVLLFDVELEVGDNVAYLITPYPQPGSAFSDRPQYAAVDSFGNLVYSTRTSQVGNLGTARKGYFAPGWSRSEAKMFVEHADFSVTENTWALAHIDSVEATVDTVVAATDSTPAIFAAVLQLYDHVPGFPEQVITGTASSAFVDAVSDAAADLMSKGSDVFIAAGASWDIPSVTFLDTTYVAGSGDGGWVAVGEGGTNDVGRVLVYRAVPLEETSLSRWIQVADLLTNPSEQVKGIGLNYDGTLGVVRGSVSSYFISPPDLRLQGITAIPAAGLGTGAALHPLHANARTLENLGGAYQPDTHLAFIGTGERTVDIIDTQRFTRIGRVYIRDLVSGPLRAVLPFPEDNAGYQCASLPVTDQKGTYIGDAVQLYEGRNFNAPIAPDGITEDRCVVIKLFAPTSGGGVVVVDVRKADVLKEHPAR